MKVICIGLPLLIAAGNAIAERGLGLGLQTAQAATQGVDARLQQRHQALVAADAEVRAAQSALDAAQRRLAEGEEPLPGERTGTASGFSRLNEAYFERQHTLRAAVISAQQRLDSALSRRNALRE